MPKHRDSAAYFYVCEHQASNDPCPKGCFPAGSKAVKAGWAKDYSPPADGLVDSASTRRK